MTPHLELTQDEREALSVMPEIIGNDFYRVRALIAEVHEVLKASDLNMSQCALALAVTYGEAFGISMPSRDEAELAAEAWPAMVGGQIKCIWNKLKDGKRELH